MAITAIYTDGGCVLKNPSEIGGTWAWVAIEEALPEFKLFSYGKDVNTEVELGGLDATAKYIKSDSGFVANYSNVKITNNVMEYIAVIKALETMEDGWSGIIYSDSQITLGRIFDSWRNKGVHPIMIERKNNAMRRLGKVVGKHVDGHPTKAQLQAGIGKRGNPVSKWNVLADELCNKQSLIIQGKITDDTSKNILQY